MAKLTKLSGLPADAAELLEAVGYLDTGDLCDADLDELITELVAANKLLDIMADAPAKKALEKWHKLAEAHEGKQPADDLAKVSASASAATGEKSKSGNKGDRGSQKKKPGKTRVGSEQNEAAGKKAEKPARDLVDFEQEPEMLAMLSISPEAESLDSDLLHTEDLDLDNVPDGLLLSRCEGNIKINIMTSLSRADSHIRQDEVRRIGLKPSRIRNFEDFKSGNSDVKPLEKGKSRDDSMPSAGLNKGVEPGTRRFIRGVLHPNPPGIQAAANSVILLSIVLVANLLGIPALVIYREHFALENTLLWIICLLVAFFLAVACYLYFAFKARCRVCGQRPLMSKKCFRHKKAHHVWGIGYILPTAIQLLLYKWFYCTYCGTAVRLKK